MFEVTDETDQGIKRPIEIIGEFLIDATIERVRRYAGDIELQYELLNKHRYKKAQIEKTGKTEFKVHTEAQGIVTEAVINIKSHSENRITQEIVMNIRAMGMKFEDLFCTFQCFLEADNKKTRMKATMTIDGDLNPMKRNLLKFGLEKEMQSEYNRLRYYIENGDI